MLIPALIMEVITQINEGVQCTVVVLAPRLVLLLNVCSLQPEGKLRHLWPQTCILQQVFVQSTRCTVWQSVLMRPLKRCLPCAPCHFASEMPEEELHCLRLQEAFAMRGYGC